MPGGVPVEQSTPDEAAFQAWKQQQAKAGSSSAHAPVPDEEDFQAWKAKQAGDVLSEHGILNGPTDSTPRPTVRPDVTSALPRNRPNASGDLQAATRNPGQQAKFIGQVAGSHLLNTAQGIPGAEAAEAYVGSKVGGTNYEQALGSLRNRITRDVGPAAGLEKIAGGMALAPFLPKNPAVAGAVLGGADRALQADPNVGVGGRLLQGAAGAATGYVAGKALDNGSTAVRAKLAPEPEQHLIDLKAARSAAADPLYDKFRALGDLGRSPELDALIGTPTTDGLPFVRKAINAVKGESPTLHNLPDTHAEVLAAVHEKVGDQAFRAMHGYTKDDARIALHDAIEPLAQAKGGSFAAPTTAFREGSQKMDAVQRGRDVLANAMSPSGGSEAAALEKSPAALKQWFTDPRTTDAERQKAVQGLLGQINRQGTLRGGRVLGTPLVPLPSHALSTGTSVLNQVDQTGALLKQLGITAFNSPFANP